MRYIWLTILISGLVLTAWGCDTSNEGAEEEVVEAAQEIAQGEFEEYYSPFLIRGQGNLKFDTISFTDVGIENPEAKPADMLVLETIAESLLYEIQAHPELEFSARVEYDEELLDPMNHRTCDADHLYVALWRGYEPDRWGYSLWSGCHERQKFEWAEIEDPDPEVEDLIEWVEPLTKSIVESIDDAHVEDCFTAVC